MQHKVTIKDLNQIPGNIKIIYQLLGESKIDATEIKTYEEYQDMYKIRHDIIHKIVCDKFDVPFGEKPVDETLKSYGINLDSNHYYEEVKKQSPDYFGVHDKIIKIIEITVSADGKAKNRKASKYALLCDVLQKAGFKIDFRIFVFDYNIFFINREENIRMGLDDPTLDNIHSVINNANLLIKAIHKTTTGELWYLTHTESLDSSQKLNFAYEDVINTHREFDNKCFHNEGDLQNLLFGKPNPKIDDYDDKFIEFCVDECSKINNPICDKEIFDVDVFYSDMKSRSNSSYLKRTLPFPLLSVDVTDSSIRDTRDDITKLISVSNMMAQSQNPVMAEMGDYLNVFYSELFKKKDEITNDDYLFIPTLSREVKDEIALDGPNRKKYIKNGSNRHYDASVKYNGYCLDPLTDVQDLEQLSFYFSQKNKIETTGEFTPDMEKLSNLDGPGLKYVKICQSIYREVNINAMRHDRRHKYVFKPTGCDGVFIMIYPGPKLRSGEMPNVAWFKIIVDNEKITDDPFCHHWIFKKVYRDRKISYSDWLSVDVHRLDHYIRCYDKILMAYYSVIAQKYKTKSDLSVFDQSVDSSESREMFSLLKEVNRDQTNTLGLIILIYMENKRTTSKMLQTVRYLVMTSLSIYPKYNSVFKKMADPIRSPLQLYLLKKSIVYYEQMKKWEYSKSVRFGAVKYDHKTHTFLDNLGGSVILLPHPIISDPGGSADFSQILSEMYFTMLFNKNQDDPTHASFQILDKIIEGEENFVKVKRNGNHLGYRNDMDDIDFAKLIINKPSLHQFSRRAIEIGSKLLRSHLNDEVGDQFMICAERKNMNKTIDEYATFKSSSKKDRDIYDPTETVQNSRRRCIEGVISLLKEELFTSYDVVDKYKYEKTYYHVFKKNQIGGVREILILPITNRIRINVLETFSRNICSYDKRESLTHGVVKNESLKAMLYNSKKLSGLRAPIHMTFDKSKWGPSFVPIQFIYLFSPFKNKIPGLFNFFVDLLIRHQNKDCILPERLVKSWYNDQKDEHNESYKKLRPLKMKFLHDKRLTMKNESNMGQGILHYTSSLLHLCLISFRDTIYKKLCARFNLNGEDHEDILSSDDSYTMFCPELYKKEDASRIVQIKLRMFLQAQRIAELLFNCRTSDVKSSINPFIGEFNSLFISNMTFMPTLFKFCLSSVHPVNTDSFYRMVKESYSSSRQIVENGGGLDLYMISSLCNKRYCESMYHVGENGHNDLAQFGIKKSPYHIGHFPIFNPALMVIFGPEYYNYKLYRKEWDNMNENEKKLFSSSHKIMKGDLINTLSEYEDGDTVLGGLLRIEAAVGPVRQLDRIKEIANLNREQLSKMIEDDPLLIITKPKTLEETMFRTTHKLYTVGSKEALKNLAASIFYGRVSASVSANAFYIPNEDKETKEIDPKSKEIRKMTYSDCIRRFIEDESPIQSIDDHMKFLYPKHVDYDIFLDNDEFSLNYYARNPFEIQTVRSLVTHKVHTKLTQSVPDILTYYWKNKIIPEHLETKVSRDFAIIQLFYPMIKDTLEETLNQFSTLEYKDQVKSVLLLILRLFSLRERVFKGVIFGLGSSDVSRSYEALLYQNMSNATSATLNVSKNFKRLESSNDKICCAYNHTILSHFSDEKVNSNMWETVKEDELIDYFQDPGISKQIKKRVFMVAISNGFMNKIEEWSDKISTIIHDWDVRQTRTEGGIYEGDCDFTLFMGYKRLNVAYNQERDEITLSKVHLSDPQLLHQFITEAAQLLAMDVKTFISKCKKSSNSEESWAMVSDKILPTIGEGFGIQELRTNFEMNLRNCRLKVTDERMNLSDQFYRPLYSMDTGLLPNDCIPGDKYDFYVFGLSFVKMCKFGAFSMNYNILYKYRTDCLELLEDLDVPKPDITSITKERLKLGDDWHLRVLEEQPDDEKDITNPESIVDATDMFFNAMITTFDPEEFKDFIHANVTELDSLVSFLVTSEVIYSMKTDTRIHQSKKLFSIVKNIKYDVICRLVLQDMKINKMTLGQVRRSFTGDSLRGVMSALISLYDRVYQTTTANSPYGIILNIDADFIKRFGINYDMVDFNF